MLHAFCTSEESTTGWKTSDVQSLQASIHGPLLVASGSIQMDSASVVDVQQAIGYCSKAYELCMRLLHRRLDT